MYKKSTFIPLIVSLNFIALSDFSIVHWVQSLLEVEMQPWAQQDTVSRVTMPGVYWR